MNGDPVQRFETNVAFECPECGEMATGAVEVPEPDWAAAEKMSELNSEGPTEISCNKCGVDFSAYVINSAGSCELVFDEHPETAIHSDVAFFSPEEEDWLEQDIVAGDPHAIFMDSYNQTGDILADHGSDDGAHLINRMVFSQQVSALEAYLGDTLLRGVRSNQGARTRLLETDKDLISEKFTLAEIAAKPDLLNERISIYLRSVLYHNLGRVDFLYRTAFNIKIMGSKDENAALLQAIKLRHDCVHRNGMDADGNRLTVFTKAYVQDIADRMRALVDRIESELKPQPTD